MKKLVALLLVFALLLSFGGCRKSTSTDPENDPTGSGNMTDGSNENGADAPVKIEDADFEEVTVITGKLLSVGDTYSFARLWERAGYRSAKPSVATVDKNGMITAVGEGTTMVMAKSGTEEKDSAIIICVVPEGKISGDIPLQIHRTGTYYLLSTVLTDAEYSSSDTSVMQVSENGLLRFLSPGYALITVTGKEGTEQYGYITYDRSLES